jgi:NADH pyrophosphatase NudC (nudix superfamily)
MGRDHSLDEFMNQSDTTQNKNEDTATPDGETGEARETETEVDEEPSLTIHPARSTMAWTGGGETCDACGDVVKRRWRDGDQLVCGECKEW